MRTLQIHYKYNYKHKLLYCLLLNYIDEFRKMKEILKVHVIINDNLSNLNLFIETDDGMLLLDEVYECINGDV